MVKRIFAAAAALVLTASVFSGCGYTRKSLLTESIKSIHVSPIKNAIDLSEEVTDQKPFRVYRPGVEVELTNAVINRFIFDGNLKVAVPEKADAIVEAKLTDYRRDALRYSDSDDVQEYRLTIVISVKVTERATGKVIWSDTGLAGDTSFFVAGPRAISEDRAAQQAVEDVARRVVDKTIEIW